MTEIGEPVSAENPTFLTSSPNGKYLYASNETQSFENCGSVTSYSIDSTTAHLDINAAGDRIVVANYIGANISILKVNQDGSLSDPIG